MAVDPEFPGHILLEQFQAQLVSAVRTAISTASSPLLLEAGLELATKVMTSSVIGGDRVALNRLFLLICRPLNDIEDLFYPSFADWVVCKVLWFSKIVLSGDTLYPNLFLQFASTELLS